MRLRHLALPAAAGLTLLAVPFAPTAVAAAADCDDSVSTCTALFEYSGGAQSFTVPAGVSNLAVAIGGARGGDGFEEGGPTGGAGGALTAIVPVTPGEVLTLIVGSKGGDGQTGSTTPAPGGYGGGGAGTNAGSADAPLSSVAAGGGGSFLFGSDGLLIAAGGGGGAGFTGATGDAADGGNGGATTGAAGAPAAFGGLGATAGSAGGAGGGDDAAAGSGPAAAPNSLGRGGSSATPCGAAGGGGGYYGGGSGGCDTTPPPAPVKAVTGTAEGTSYAGAVTTDAEGDDLTIYHSGGGGGGSGFAAGGVSLIETDLTSDLDNGVIGIGYTTAPTTTTLATDVTTVAPGQEATIDATVDGPALTIAGDDAEDSPAVAAAATAFGAEAAAAVAAAVPTTPAPAGTTLTPGTACGATPCTVTFFVNGTALGDPISIDAATGVATVIFTAGSDEGVREITARYDGNLYYLQSTSDPLSITVAGLANTGPGNVVPMLGASALLLAAGAGLVGFGRRRPQLGAHRAI